MRSTFDRLREVRNRSIYQVILDRYPIQEEAPEAALAASHERTRKLTNQHDIRTTRSVRARVERRRRTQKAAHGAWYVDCTSRPRGSAEGEEIQ